MKTKNTENRVKLNELAKRSGYSRQAITSWTTAGLLQRVNGKYDLVASLEAIKQHEAQRGTDGSHDVAELRDLKRQLFEKKIEKLSHEIAVAKGLVHSKELCCVSLTQIFSAESRALHNLGRCIVAQFPEAPKGTLAAIDKEVDEMLRRLKYGVAYQGEYFCPHCRKLIDEFFLEPITEGQQTAPVTSVPATGNTKAGDTNA